VDPFITLLKIVFVLVLGYVVLRLASSAIFRSFFNQYTKYLIKGEEDEFKRKG